MALMPMVNPVGTSPSATPDADSGAPLLSIRQMAVKLLKNGFATLVLCTAVIWSMPEKENAPVPPPEVKLYVGVDMGPPANQLMYVPAGIAAIALNMTKPSTPAGDENVTPLNPGGVIDDTQPLSVK